MGTWKESQNDWEQDIAMMMMKSMMMMMMLLLLLMMMMMRGKRACAIFSPSCANFWSVYAQNLLLA